MKTYQVTKISTPKVLKSIPPPHFQINWTDIASLNIDNYPWYQSGRKQNTQVKLCTDSEQLFIQVIAQDAHSFSKQTSLNHMRICEDSCFEFFFSPSGDLGSGYINLEVNCCGTFHLAYGCDRHNRTFVNEELAHNILCRSSLNVSSKVEKQDDKAWIIDITLPFYVIEQLSGNPVNKEKWFVNFYRCGGRVEPQYGVWNDLGMHELPSADFHQPRMFGMLEFN